MQKTIPYEKLETYRTLAHIAGLEAEAKTLRSLVMAPGEPDETATEAATPATTAPKAATKKAAAKKEEPKAEVDMGLDLSFGDEEPAKEEPPADKKTILAAAQKFVETKGMPAFHEVLKGFGVTKLQEVKAEDVQKFYQKVK